MGAHRSPVRPATPTSLTTGTGATPRAVPCSACGARRGRPCKLPPSSGPGDRWWFCNAREECFVGAAAQAIVAAALQAAPHVRYPGLVAALSSAGAELGRLADLIDGGAAPELVLVARGQGRAGGPRCARPVARARRAA